MEHQLGEAVSISVGQKEALSVRLDGSLWDRAVSRPALC